ILNDKNNYYGGTFLVPRAGQNNCIVVPSTKPTTTPNTVQCVFSPTPPQKDTQYAVVYDRNFWGGKSKICGRWFYDNGNARLPFGAASTLAFPQVVVQNNRFASISHTHQISNRQLNEFRFGFSRFIASFVPTDKVSLADINATRPNSSSVP